MEKLEFKEFSKKSLGKSSVWNSFVRTADGVYAKCKQCNKILKCQNTTTCLHNHLKRHREHDNNEASTSSAEPAASATALAPQKRKQKRVFDEDEPVKKKTRIDDYFQTSEDDMETMVSKMTACDGLPFSIFCTSESIKKLFLKSGYKNLPKSPNTIKKIVVTKCEYIKNKLTKELTSKKAEGQKFSVTLDEWSSDNNRRYLNVNIHSPIFNDKPFINLGLARIQGRATAEHCVDILQRKLATYDLSLEKDIACAVTDGASVMCSLGRKVPSYHQQCLAHGIQCAVIDALYKKDLEDTEDNEQWLEAISTTTNQNSSGSGDEDSETDEESSGFIVQTGNPSRIRARNLMDYKELIDKVRSVVKFFKKSPTRTEILNSYLCEQNKKLQLILDCKTRWNSLANMIERFLVLKDAVMKALIDLKNKTTFSALDFCILEDFSTSLNVVKVTVEAICQENANLLTAEAALQFMIAKLETQTENSIISRRLLNALKNRIIQRRNEDLVCTLKYLHNPSKYYNEPPSEIFICPGNDAITRLIIHINQRYFDCNRQNQNTNNEDNDIGLANIQVHASASGDDQENEKNKTLKDQLQQTIDDAISADASTSAVDLISNEEFETAIRMEMAIFDRGGPRQTHLSQAYNFLLCIPPTSVECERVFSSTKYLTNHLRCALRDDSIDALSFLRSYYQANRN